MILPTSQYSRLFGNAVCVPCAAFAISRICNENERIRHVDLCSGIGGFSFALEKHVHVVSHVGFSEIMQAAKRCYIQNFPDTPDLGKAEKAVWPQCDLLTAGFPCQPFSCSNSRYRRENHKSRNFYEVVLNAISCSGATRVVLENVPSFRTTGHEQFEDMMETLKKLGFHTSCQVLVSTDSGVPQQRRRLYIVGSKLSRPLSWERPRVAVATLQDILEDSTS